MAAEAPRPSDPPSSEVRPDSSYPEVARQVTQALRSFFFCGGEEAVGHPPGHDPTGRTGHMRPNATS